MIVLTKYLNAECKILPRKWQHLQYFIPTSEMLNVVEGLAVQQYKPSDGENLTIEILLYHFNSRIAFKNTSFQCRQLR